MGNGIIELKPCPFCGSVASISKFNYGYSGTGDFSILHRVGCDSCCVYFRHESEFNLVNGCVEFSVNGLKKAVEMWNKRANTEE